MQITDITLMQADCMNLLPGMIPGLYDIGIVDPVYGVNGNYHRRNKTRSKLSKSVDYHAAIWDQKPPTTEYFDQLFRVTKDQIIWGANYFQHLHPKLQIDWPANKTPRKAELETFILQNPRGLIIWDKVNYSKFNDFEIAWTSFDIPTQVFPFMWSGMMQGISFTRGTEMNPLKQLNEVRVHPTHKPVALYKYLLHKFARMGMSILDTHLGGGSIIIACLDFGCNLTAIEIEPEYFQRSQKRYQQHISQLKLL